MKEEKKEKQEKKVDPKERFMYTSDLGLKVISKGSKEKKKDEQTSENNK